MVSPDPVIKSRSGNLVIHVPSDGDLLFAAPDLPEEVCVCHGGRVNTKRFFKMHLCRFPTSPSFK
jgi:hypothetical protein